MKSSEQYTFAESLANALERRHRILGMVRAGTAQNEERKKYGELRNRPTDSFRDKEALLKMSHPLTER